MKLFVLQAGFADVDKGDVLTPGSGDGTVMRIPVPMYLVEHDDRSRTLIDTGMHPVHVEDPGHTFAGSPLADAIAPVMRPEDRLEHRLAELGLAVRDITRVVNTHLHFDHCGQNGLFPGVPILVQRAAYEPAMAEDGYARAYFDRPGLRYELVDGDVEPAPGLCLVASPGHAAGFQAVLVRLPVTGEVLLCGDAIAVREQLDTGNWQACADPVFGEASAARLRSLADDTGALMIFGHDPQQWDELRRAPEGCYE
jgi:N-acyl homoserine lactone hydrolase